MMKRPKWWKSISSIWMKLKKAENIIKSRLRLPKIIFLMLESFSPFIPSQPCSFPGIAHYSWDYAQQLHYPTNPQQPGPIYFKTTRKCGIFGIVNDGNSLQHNYLIDEAVALGKGANSTISYVHHYLREHGMGETDALLHADNCSGESLIYYLNFGIMLNHIVITFCRFLVNMKNTTKCAFRDP